MSYNCALEEDNNAGCNDAQKYSYFLIHPFSLIGVWTQANLFNFRNCVRAILPLNFQTFLGPAVPAVLTFCDPAPS